MSIKVQKILMFIPIVNLVAMFFWLYAVYKNNVKKSKFIKQLLTIFAANLVMVAFRMIISEISMNDTLYTILFWIFLYLSMLITAGLSIYYQELILKKKNRKKKIKTD